MNIHDKNLTTASSKIFLFQLFTKVKTLIYNLALFLFSTNIYIYSIHIYHSINTILCIYSYKKELPQLTIQAQFKFFVTLLLVIWAAVAEMQVARQVAKTPGCCEAITILFRAASRKSQVYSSRTSFWKQRVGKGCKNY